MKKVLFLAYLFPPIANSGTQRPLKFAKYLAEYGWEPTVITAVAASTGIRPTRAWSRICPANVRVVRVPMLNEEIGNTLALARRRRPLRAARLGDAVRWRMQHRRRSPDLYAWWKPTVIREVTKLLATTRFDAIYATGFPWTSLLIGGELSKATGIPLVADFRDLWAGENLFRSERPPHDRGARARAQRGRVRHRGRHRVGRALAGTWPTAHPSVERREVRDRFTTASTPPISRRSRTTRARANGFASSSPACGKKATTRPSSTTPSTGSGDRIPRCSTTSK